MSEIQKRQSAKTSGISARSLVCNRINDTGLGALTVLVLLAYVVCMCIYSLMTPHVFPSTERKFYLSLGLKNELPMWYNYTRTQTVFCLSSDIFRISHQGDVLDHYSLLFADLL
jgi:hypothetical protein